MYRGHSVAVVVPAYEERDTVGAVLTAQPSFVDVVYAVDDGSTDGTTEVLHRAASTAGHPVVEPLVHTENRGAGAAVATGYRRARTAGHDTVVTVDADGQMDLDRMPDLLDPLVDGHAAYAKGDRLSDADHRERMPRHRVVGNLLLTGLTRLACGSGAVTDPQNGYTAITGETLGAVDLDRLPDSHAYCNDLLAQLDALDAPVVDVPMPAIYGDESSTIHYPRFVATTLRVLGAEYLRRLRGEERGDVQSPSRQRS